MGSCGGGNDTSQTSFRRVGGSQSDRTRAVPAWLLSAMQGNIGSGTISSGLGTTEDNFLSGIMSQDYTKPPGVDKTQSTQSMDPQAYPGSSSLASIANTDPFSSVYSEKLKSFYDNLFGEAAAAGGTGPEAVRGGAAHGAMVKGQVLEKAALDKFDQITKLQLAQQDRTMSGAQMASAIEMARRTGILGAQNQVAQQWIEGNRTGARGSELLNMKRRVGADAITSLSDMLAPTKNLTRDDLSGSGNQESSHFGWNAGINCCFIFLEALNGDLPWYIRRGRDIIGTERERKGYVSMASWLVPLMRRYRSVRTAVNLLMVKPFLIHGAFFFNAEGARPIIGRLLTPICVSWLKVWDLLGKKG